MHVKNSTTHKSVVNIAERYITLWEEAKKNDQLSEEVKRVIKRLLKCFGSFTNKYEQNIQVRLFSLVS